MDYNINKIDTDFFYKELFLKGAYFVTLIVAFISIIFNLISNNFFNLKINLIYFILIIILLLIYKYKRNLYFSTISLFWLSSIIEAIFLYIKVDINLIFVVLLPLIIYIILPLKKLIFHMIIFYILIFFVLFYEYNSNMDSLLRNNKYILNFILANLIILFYGFLYNITINRFIINLKSTNEQKNILLKEIHHRVKNNLNLISSIIGLHLLKVSSKDAKEILQANQNRIKSMAILHEILYKKDNLNKIDFKTYINEISKYILESENENKNIKLNLKIDNIKIDIDNMVLFGILINELITNSIKHTKSNSITLNIYFLDKGKFYEFRYFDSNKIDKNRIIKGFGSHLIDLTVEQLKGEIISNTKDNLEYIIIFKK